MTHRKYFEKVKTAGELTIPKLNEIAYEQVEIAGTTFSTFVADKTAEGGPAGRLLRAARICPYLAEQNRQRIRPCWPA